MYREHTIGVVVPAYNEEGFVGDVIRSIPSFVDRVYVVDDCSTDGTWSEIVAAARDDLACLADGNSPDNGMVANQHVTADGGTRLTERIDTRDGIGRVTPIKHRENSGAGGAIKTGYLAALEDEIDVIVTIDGDGQMDPGILRRFLDPVVDGKADYAKGNRLLNREYRRGMSKWRFFGNSLLTFLTKIASGYWKTMDPQNGYTAISRHALENVDVEEMYEYYGYCNDLLVKLNAKGFCVADVAMPAQYGEEASSIQYPTYIRKVSGMLLRNFLWRLKTRYLVLDFHPLALFYLFGVVAGALGAAGVSWSLYSWQRLETPLFVRIVLSGLLFAMGSLFLLFAMVFDMQANENREVQIHA